jgi:hypothetical protein
MGPKAKKGGGKGKKGKGKAKEEEAVPETEYDTMDLEMLQEVVPMLRQQLEKSMLDRNYVQLERDTIQQFYDISKRESQEVELQIAAREREMGLMDESHRVEVRVYVQKVKHLEYEQKQKLAMVQAEAETEQEEVQEYQDIKMESLRDAKLSLNRQVRERELANAEEIMQIQDARQKNLSKLREGFEQSLAALKDKCEQRLVQLDADLELRRKVDVHEIEERKNTHINDLIKNHAKAFGQIKTYYNDITNDNLTLIKSLKNELVEMKKRAVANQQLMQDISQENKRLSEPLSVAVVEVTQLRAQLKDQGKDKLSLANTRARLRAQRGQSAQLRDTLSLREAEFAALEKERDDLYDSFEGAVAQVQQRSEFHNLVLERKVAALEDGIERSSTQLQELVRAAGIPAEEAQRILSSLNNLLTVRNTQIRSLKYDLIRETKAYNDSIRTYQDKLQSLGIPKDEIAGAAEGLKPIPLGTCGPAGLVTAH